MYFTEPHDRHCADPHTLHVLAKYLRDRSQDAQGDASIFLISATNRANRQVVALLTAIGTILNSDSYPDRHFRLVRSNQRAIGELVVRDGEGSCMGYAEFYV